MVLYTFNFTKFDHSAVAKMKREKEFNKWDKTKVTSAPQPTIYYYCYYHHFSYYFLKKSTTTMCTYCVRTLSIYFPSKNGSHQFFFCGCLYLLAVYHAQTPRNDKSIHWEQKFAKSSVCVCTVCRPWDTNFLCFSMCAGFFRSKSELLAHCGARSRHSNAFFLYQN